MTRTQELQSIGLFRINDIAEKIQKHKDTVRYRISILGIVPFEKWWYDEYQLEMIINFEIYKKRVMNITDKIQITNEDNMLLMKLFQ